MHVSPEAAFAATSRRVGRWLTRGSRRRRLYDAANVAAPRLLGNRVRSGPAKGLRFEGGDTPGYLLGMSEPVVQAALVEHLQPGGTFFDVGAHVGFMSVLASRLVGPEGVVVAFEPLSANLRRTQDNVTSNAGAARFDGRLLALSDRDGRMKLAVGEKEITARLSEDEGMDVDVARLDSLDVPAPDVIKIDVEGAECDVLRGMPKLLKAHAPTLIIEIHGGTEPAVRELLAGDYRDIVLHADGGMPHLIATAR